MFSNKYGTCTVLLHFKIKYSVISHKNLITLMLYAYLMYVIQCIFNLIYIDTSLMLLLLFLIQWCILTVF